MDNLIGAKRGLFRGQTVLVLVGMLLFVLATRPEPTHGAAQTLFINEIMVSNSAAVLDNDTTNFSDWIEIYNAGSTSADLGGMYLSDDPADLEKWRIPSGTNIPAGGHYLFWADGLDEDNHTLFKLKHDGEILTLADDNGTPIDVLDYTAIPQLVNVSFGRQLDGDPTWVYFGEPTPDSSNNGANSVADASQIADEPNFSSDGGFYSGSKNVSLSAAEPGAVIYYTTDGSTPDDSATLYSGSLNISNTTVIRARTYAPGYLPSPIATATFFIDEFSTLPIVSISVEPEYFFDDDIGIYVKGSGGADNYYEDWKRPIHLEMYETDGTMAFSFDGGVELHGNYSRRMPMKSLHVFTGDQYGSGDIDYQLFDDKDIDEFESFILRNSGSDFSRTLYRDAMMQELIKDQFSDIDYQAYRPAIVFLNGEYWGIHNFREKINKTYPENNHGADPDNLDMLRDGNSVMEGDRDQFNDILDFIDSNDMTDVANYEYVKSLVDVGEFMNYMIAEVYYGNIDWPANNVKFWREREDGSRWRWILFDTDQGFNPRDDDLFAYDSVDWVTQSNTGFIRQLFNGLSESPEFTAEFAQRFATHINITYEETRVIDIIDTMQAGIAPEMPRHINAWKNESPRIASLSDWEENVELMRDFARKRPTYMYDFIDDGLNLNGTAELTIDIQVADGGIVLIHSVEMPGNSFTGTFFRNIPIRLEAIPNPGHRFVEWEEIGVTDLKTTHTISSDDT
ncbi:MAG: CotH kinase family protein, partial [Anaerolineales bacterium]|nr:CotH kinase family protein [Anaerolineales bacterium]